MLAAANNIYSTLAQAAAGSDTSILLTSAAGFPAKGVIVLSGTANPLINEVVYYSAKAGNALTGCIRGFDGTTAEIHDVGAAVALAIVAKHISDLQPRHGNTALRGALAASLTVDDTGRRFYDTDIDEMFEWIGSKWVQPAVMGFGRQLREYYGTPAEVLPLIYRRGDRWTDSASPKCTVRVCTVDVITHTLVDWFSVGRQN